MKINDDNFLLEMKNKNTRALEFIIDCYSNLVFKAVLNVLGSENRESAKECVNDIFLLVWNKHHLYNPEKSSFKNWLLAISKYKAIDYKRKLSRHTTLELEENLLFTDKDLEGSYILKEKKEELLTLLDNGNKIDKEIFIRKYLLDEDTDIIAQKLKLSKGAVYNRLWRTKNLIIKNFNSVNNLEVVK
ncbi:sigma-70 family RNA polymerase sigma factor [Clostridium hydrogenum]|uniref:sigma-70 family RNA polymerase sigma factor n=1 Tax=Clostridium hydrogenum TaxID=2855764 RepID=UPI001F1E21D3|nr:sigma-70 family RNA polymerase sigma factor [Clostridium hydrogenum]